MTSLGFRPKHMSLKKFISWNKVSKKLRRKRDNNASIKFKKNIREVLRIWQKSHNGRLPDLSVIPKGTYCDSGYGLCPYYYSFKASEDYKHPGLVTPYQTMLGGCHLINKTDDNLNGYGLLFDGIKECPF